jgi:hypothetical protein
MKLVLQVLLLALAIPAQAAPAMVAAANPHAARAGIEILRAGGSALDAAIAVQMVLNLVEPQSSGIGGGAFLLFFLVLRFFCPEFRNSIIAPFLLAAYLHPLTAQSVLGLFALLIRSLPFEILLFLIAILVSSAKQKA